jgi:YesN/AraC family two-component response regulator
MDPNHLYFPDAVIQDSDLVSLFLRMHYSLEVVTSSLEQEFYFLEFMIRLMKNYAKVKLPDTTIYTDQRRAKWIREYIDAHFAEKLTLKKLAQIFHVSEFHLIRLFKREMQIPPHLYLNMVRINKA